MLVEKLELPNSFDGTVRLFPLPELVLFPQMVLPLHIFEPRYCEMLRAAQRSDQLITMATLLGDEHDPESISRFVCIGQIISHEETSQETHNILLAGVTRAKIITELPQLNPFRTAEVQPIDETDEMASSHNSSLGKQLIDAFAGGTENHEKLKTLFNAPGFGLGVLTDLIAYNASLPTEVKLELLDEHDTEKRARRILREIAPTSKNVFPPPFSMN